MRFALVFTGAPAVNPNDPYMAVSNSLDGIVERHRYDQRNRLALLAIHGVIGVVVGVLMTFGDPPVAFQMLFGMENKLYLAVPPMIGGSILLSGLAAGRILLAEAIGMFIMFLWDLGMVGVFIVQSIETSTPVYAVAVYGGLAALMAVHLRTLYLFIHRAHLKRGGDQ